MELPSCNFSGQIAAALVSGNCVIAKPAEQTLNRSSSSSDFMEAGIPHGAVQLLPGRGETVGAQLSQDSRIDGIMFTGSTEVAKFYRKPLRNVYLRMVNLFLSLQRLAVKMQ